MNKIILNKKIDYVHIIPAHAEAFEKQVLELYFDASARTRTLPYVDDDIMYIGNPKYHFAGILGYLTGNEDEYLNEIEGMTEREAEEHLERLGAEFYDEDFPHQTNEFMGLLHNDVQSVLDYHRLSYIDLIPQFGSYQPSYAIVNLPVEVVW